MGNASLSRVNINFKLSNHGFECYRAACPPDVLATLQAAFPLDSPPDHNLHQTSPLVAGLLADGFFHDLASTILGPEATCTHAILYNRTAANNTPQEWHQDTQIRLPSGETVEAPDGFDYNRLLSLRLSLDDSTFLDGGVKLCPASHVHGKLTAREVRGHSIRPFSSPEMKAGDVLAMHPLTIHASGASQTLKPRRVIHAVYSLGPLS